MIVYTFLVTLTVSLANSKNPGLKARITQAGLTYADQVAIDKLGKSAVGQKIPDQTGRSGDVTYEISNIIIQGFTTPSSSIVVAADGLNWNANGLGLGIRGHFHYKYHGILGEELKFYNITIRWQKNNNPRALIIPISDSGDIDVSVSGVSFSVGVSLGADPTGRPTIASTGCRCNIGSVSVDFHGGTAWIYNLFKSFVEDALRDQLNGQLCTIINNAVNTDASRALAKLQVTVDIAKVFLLDYRFLGRPAFNPQSFLETYHKGEVFWTSSVSEAPFDPLPMPAINSTQKMMYIWVSDYVFNTLTYEAQTHGVLVYNLTQKDLPDGAKDFLNTTCKGSPCIGSIIPQIGHRFPNNQVQMFMSSDFSPIMMASQGKINVQCGGTIIMATTQGNTFLLSLNATMHTSVGIDVRNENIYASVGDMSIKLHVMKSNVGELNDIILDTIANIALVKFVEPQLNKLGAKGIPLPVTENVHFVNTQIGVDQDTLMIATDLKYE